MQTQTTISNNGPIHSIEVIQVIRTEAVRGKGADEDPSRIVTQYWSLDGQLLAEVDVVAQPTVTFSYSTTTPPTGGE
jgi:hypothetical protein